MMKKEILHTSGLHLFLKKKKKKTTLFFEEEKKSTLISQIDLL